MLRRDLPYCFVFCANVPSFSRMCIELMTPTFLVGEGEPSDVRKVTYRIEDY